MHSRAIVAGNWKMNGSRAAIDEFAPALADAAAGIRCPLAVCVPFVYVSRLAERFADTTVAVGGQDVAAEVEAGAFTGEVSGEMLIDAGATHTVVGHSERREKYGETDAIVVAKTRAAVTAGLVPIVCVGETLEQRENDQVEAVLGRQLGALLDGCSAEELDRIVLAYEPIWAIGTGRTATPEQAQEIHAYLRSQIADRDATLARSLSIVYGGSVKPDNAEAIFAGDDVDGALVGGASLKADSFADIARAMDAVGKTS
ncbi:triose-phosphate isomerase [Salinisphaera sp. Q1T1-3]|uniref:triose-phosphate isomerase n=1 Tax=Salinisphaera sp. Q1T1-3 TaxID=2321229 RepID=UPI000E75AC80|nr:triose-phosphate isomerase [Salinisphaera sp. Q1T1-3]RJS92716.1 triose-phosphate isomerase [Salinisphaera sp. Q1T1-3]